MLKSFQETQMCVYDLYYFSITKDPMGLRLFLIEAIFLRIFPLGHEKLIRSTKTRSMQEEITQILPNSMV